MWWIVMFIVTYYSLTSTQGYLLCNSTRDLVEHNVKMGTKWVIQPLEFYQAVAASANNMGNIRNKFDFDVTRDMDYNGRLFGDPEAAYVFAIDQTNLLPPTGYLKIQMSGSVTGQTRYLTDVVLEEIEPVDWMGVAASFRYSFNGGLYTTTPPNT